MTANLGIAGAIAALALASAPTVAQAQFAVPEPEGRTAIPVCPGDPRCPKRSDGDDAPRSFSKAPRAATASAGPRATAIGSRQTIALLFSTSSADLSPKTRADLDALTPALLNGTTRFVIEGHADEPGTKATNLRLSEKRAGAVRDYLVARGVPPAKLEARGYGNERRRAGLPPLAPGNRRVEIVRAD